VGRLSACCLPGRSSSRPPLLHRPPHHQAHRQQGKRRRQRQGRRQRQQPKHRPRRQQRTAPRASAERPAQPPPTQIPSSNALQRSARPCHRPRHVPGRRPGAPRGRRVRHQRAQVHTPHSRPKRPGYGAQHLMGQRERTAERGAALHTSARPRPAHSYARCKWAWPPQQKTAQEAGHGKRTPPPQLRSRGRTPVRALPAASDPGQKRLLELNAQAGGLGARLRGSIAPGARLQHELAAEVERAKHRALWVRARAVRPPGNDATAWHAAENTEYLKA
jgi:hypothetical protein